MSDLDPTGPSQPTLSQSYTTPGNATTKNPSEVSQTNSTARDNSNSSAVDQRIPQKQTTGEGMPSSLGRGIHGAPTGEEGKGLGKEDVGRHKELDGEQMAAPGEGRIADAVAGRTGGVNLGGSGEQPDLAADLERKKAEQQEARDAVLQAKGADTKMGQAGGAPPASTVS